MFYQGLPPQDIETDLQAETTQELLKLSLLLFSVFFLFSSAFLFSFFLLLCFSFLFSLSFLFLANSDETPVIAWVTYVSFNFHISLGGFS